MFICPKKGDPMLSVERVQALAGAGLEGDRYASGEGSYNAGKVGTRQVTLMNVRFFLGQPFTFQESRRNLLIEGAELMWLIGREFTVGAAKFRGQRYCDPCRRPDKLAGKEASFKDTFQDAGGLIAEVLESGLICLGDALVPPPKPY
jgi:MOSC domain-containing protein YiiM